MPTTPVTPYVPQYITVHLGAPSAAAENVTVSFPEYVKNVASSEIYPTWEPAAIRANILAIISFALNRVYTEYYPSRGYPFNITASTAYDQKFIKGRNIFENISQMVDEIFNSYRFHKLKSPPKAKPALWSPWQPNFATAPPPPATVSPSGAARPWQSRAPTPSPSCETIMATISRS